MGVYARSSQESLLLGAVRLTVKKIRARVRPVRLLLIALGLTLSSAGGVFAESSYPTKPITIIVPYAPGGGGDIFTRAIAFQAQEKLGRKVSVENRTGGGATIGVGVVARAPMIISLALYLAAPS